MISYETLAERISATKRKRKVQELTLILQGEQFVLRDLIDLTFTADKNIAFRAAWILENFFLKQPEACLPDLDYLLSRIKDVRWESCQRHYAKILMHLTGLRKPPPAIKQQLAQTNLDVVTEQCFDWLIDKRVKIAVKCFAAETLFNLRGRYPWIVDELPDQLQYLMRDGTAAIQSRGRKLIALMKK